MTTPTPSVAPVIALHPQKAEQLGAAPTPTDRRSERKWGKAVIDIGYTIVPSILLRAPRRLGLSPTQLAITLVLAEYWWDPAKNPWPSKADLCNRIGLRPRQLQRHIAEMEQAGLIKRKQRFLAGRKTTNEYDLSGLVQKLKALAPEFQEAKRAAKARQEAVSVPAGRRASTKTPA
jgi:hypothetical protein